MSVITFELTEQHVLLARRMCVHWDDSCYDGAPCIDIKRPYGNSYVIGDLYEIVFGQRWDYDGHNDLSIEEADEGLCAKLLALHREMETALQIILTVGTFEPGTYTAEDWLRDWRPV